MKRMDLFVLALVIISSIWFSWWLMSRTFGYDSDTHFIKVDAKLWSDFGAAIPLIRSFSMGDNWPPQYPGFPGEPIRYHFGFYFLAGILEKMGVRLDWALNIPSIIGFAGLMTGIYLLGKYMTKNIWSGILPILFFLFNGSLGFLTYFNKHGWNRQSVIDIYSNHRFPVFGPWDGQDISAFWTLNIFTNQRHLAFSYAGVIFMVLLLIHYRKSKIRLALFTAILMCTLLVVNQASALIAMVFCLWFFLVLPYTRAPLLASGLLCIPWAYYLSTITTTDPDIMISPGYLMNTPLTPGNIIAYWWHNIGLHTILIPLGLIISPKKIKMLFIIPLLVLFISPNVLKLSADMINNHKFFNFFIIIGGMFSGLVVICLIRLISHIRQIWLKVPLFLFPFTLFFFLIASGIIDFFAIYNKEPGGLPDIQNNPTAMWIYQNTPPDAVFLNSTWFYHPANMAGRFIFSGYSYFTWSYGYNKDAQEQILKSIYNAPDPVTACSILKSNNISYIELNPGHDTYFDVNPLLYDSIFTPEFIDPGNRIRIYNVDSICTPYVQI